MNERKADFILRGEEVIYPEMPKTGLELYYDIGGKTNQDTKKSELLDMSGKGRHGSLSGFDYSGLSGYHDGLVFDEIDDTLTRPVIAGLDPNNLTYQVNGNIVRFKPDGTSQMVKGGEVVEIGRNYFSNKTFDQNNEFRLTDYNSVGSFTQFFRLTKPMSFFVGKEVVLSFDVISPNGATPLQVYNTNGNPRYLMSVSGVITPISDTWTKQIIRVTVTDRGDTFSEPNSNKVEIYASAKMGATIRNVKWEIGSVATPWTPTPEDLIDNLSCKNNVLGDLENVIDDMDLDTKTGESVTFEGYKDNHIDVTVEGNTVQSSDWYAKDGFSTQYQDTKVMGKNIIPTEFYQWEPGHYALTNGVAEPYADRIRIPYLVEVTPNQTYYFNTGSPSVFFVVRAFDANKNFVESWGGMTDTGSKIVAANIKYIGIALYNVAQNLYQGYFLDGTIKPMWCLSSAGTAYEPYKDIIKNGLVLEYNGANFFNSPQTTSLKDRSGNGNHGTPSGFSYTTASGSDGNGGVRLNKTSKSYIDTGLTVPETGSFEMVFTPNTINYNYNSLWEQSASPDTYEAWIYSNGILAARAGSSAIIQCDLNTLGGPTAQYHLVFSWDSATSEQKLYINGVLRASNSLLVSSPRGFLTIGGKANTASDFTMHAFRAYNKVLSLSEVYQNYMAGVNLNMPSPTDPSPVVSNLPAGTYKYTSTDGIYEFTLDEELRGIGASLDRIVFDRVSKQGKLERRVVEKVFDGTEVWSLENSSYPDYIGCYTTIANKKYGMTNILNSKFKVSASSYPPNGIGTTTGRSNNKAVSINIPTTIATTANELKTWVLDQYNLGLPIILHYESENVTTTPLTFTKVSSSTKTEVPMTFLTATPSLDYPAQVWDGGGNVVGRGKNLIFPNNSNYNGVGITIVKNADLSITVNGTTTAPIGYRYAGFWDNKIPVLILKAGTYTLSTDKILPSGSSFAILNTTHTGYSLYTGMYSTTFTLTRPFEVTDINFASNTSGITYNNDTFHFQLEESSVATPYEPYKPIVNQTIPTLRKIGTVADTYNPASGKYAKRVSDWVTLDGSLGWGRSPYMRSEKVSRFETSTNIISNSVDYSTENIMTKYDSSVISFISTTALEKDKAYIYGKNIRIGVSHDEAGLSNVESFPPSNAEVKAYFYGWKMCNADGTSPYYKSEVPYTPSTWAEWVKESGVTADSTGMTFTGTGSYVNAKIPMTFKPTTKYGLLYNVVSSNISGNFSIRSGGGDGSTDFAQVVIPKTLGNNKINFTTDNLIATNLFWMFISPETTVGQIIKVKDIRIFELPAGSQIETDFDTLTADQLAAKYTFNGLCVKNWKKVTDGTGQTATLPTASYEGYTPYKMIYQLATPVTSYLPPARIPTYYPTTVIETDSLSYCKPAITAKIKAIDYLKETRTINNMQIWSRFLSDAELIKQYRLFHERYRMKSPTVNGVPIEGFVWIEGGAYIGSTMSTDMTIYI